MANDNDKREVAEWMRTAENKNDEKVSYGGEAPTLENGGLGEGLVDLGHERLKSRLMGLCDGYDAAEHELVNQLGIILGPCRIANHPPFTTKEDVINAVTELVGQPKTPAPPSAQEVKRYNIRCMEDEAHYGLEVEHEAGDYVLHSSYVSLEARCRELELALNLAATRFQLAYDADEANSCDVWAEDTRKALKGKDVTR